MPHVDWYVYWIVIWGLIAQIWLALKAGKVLGAVLYAVIAATSYTRFAWQCGRVHGFRPRRFPQWLYGPNVWFSFFVTLIGTKAGSVQHFGGAGVWRGVGDWTVFPAKEAA